RKGLSEDKKILGHSVVKEYLVIHTKFLQELISNNYISFLDIFQYLYENFKYNKDFIKFLFLELEIPKLKIKHSEISHLESTRISSIAYEFLLNNNVSVSLINSPDLYFSFLFRCYRIQ